MRFRKIAFALVLGLIALFAFSATAYADDEVDGGAADLATVKPGPAVVPDPQTTNVPYIGWLGNQIKLMKCLPFIDTYEPTEADLDRVRSALSISLPGTFQVEDWSGVDEVNAGPRWLNGQIGFNSSTVPLEVNLRGICWSAHVTSNKPGLAVIKLAVSLEVLLEIKHRLDSDGLASLFSDLDSINFDLALLRSVLLKHQFLAIWLQSQNPVIKEISDKEPGGIMEHGAVVGDPAGDGKFQPPYDCTKGDHAAAAAEDGDAESDRVRRNPLLKNLWCVFGVVKATIKGTFPLGNDFAVFGKPTVTLPDDWAWLAGKIAVDDTGALGGAPGSASARWDIHDDNTDYDGNLFNPAVHSTTNGCFIGGTAVGTDAVDDCLGGWDSGPFSRVVGNTSPFTIGPYDPLWPQISLLNNGTLDAYDAPMPPIRLDFMLDANSIGAFGKADKDDVYDANNTTRNPHELYAPFYEARIPAVTPVIGDILGLSGVAGSFTNNFPGFIEHGIYDYWSKHTWVYRYGGNECDDPLGHEYPKPTGPSHVTVYTDEHGEAFIKFFPYRGNFLTPAQHLCNVAPGLYGTANITAVAHYPDQQPLWDGSKTSNTLVKQAWQKADKSLDCIKKAGFANVLLCVETVLDWNGDPVEGVPVHFSTSAENAKVLDAEDAEDDYPPYNLTGQQVKATDPGGNFRWIVIETNKYGQAGVDVISSELCVDVVSQNVRSDWEDPKSDGVEEDSRRKDYGGSPAVTLTHGANPYTGALCGGAPGENPLEQPVGSPPKPGDNGNGNGGTPPPPPPPPPPAANGGTTGGGGSSGGSSSGGSDSTVVSLGGPVIQATPVLTGGKTATIIASNARLFSVKVVQSQLGRFLIVNVKANKNAAKGNVLFLVKNKKTGKLMKIWKKVPAATVRIQILDKQGKVIQTVTRRVAVNKAFTIQNLKLPKAAASVRTSVIA